MTGHQPCNFGYELNPLARYDRDRLNRTDRDAIAATRAGRSIDDRAASLAGSDADGGVIANFCATAAGNATSLDTGGRAADRRQQSGRRLVGVPLGFSISGFRRKEGGQQGAS
jgi:hypothetical protein